MTPRDVQADEVQHLGTVALGKHLVGLARDRDAVLRLEPIAGEWRAEFFREHARRGNPILIGARGPSPRHAMERLATMVTTGL